MFQIFGINSIALHAGSLLLTLLESLLLYLAGARLFSPGTGGQASLAYAVASTNFYTPRIIGFTPEQLMVVFTTAAIYVSVRALQSDRAIFLFWSGMLAIAAVLSKPAAVPELLIFPLFVMLFPGLPPVRRTRALVWFAIGCMAATSVLLLTLGSAGTLKPWWIQSVSSRVYYVSQFGWAVFLRQLARQPLTFGLFYFWMWVLIRWGLRGSGAKQMGCRFVLIWLAAGFLGVLMGRRFYANYYIQIFPALSLLAAVGMDRLLQDGLRKSKVPVMVCLITLLLPFLWFQSRTFAHWYFFIDGGAHQRVNLWEMCVIDRNQGEISREIRSASRQ